MFGPQTFHLPLQGMISTSISVSPSTLYSVYDYGAVGDGRVMDTAAIQQAIDAASAAGGGTVLLPPGTFRSAPLRLASRIRLHLERGAVLLASSNPDDYLDWQGRKFISSSAVYNARYFIGAEGATDLAITGEGSIDGCGDAFYDDSDPSRPWAIIRDKATRPARMLLLADCHNVLVQGVSLVNAPAWTVWAVGCERVRFEGVRIETNYRYINTDGIDIDGCRDVTIANSRIRTGDDAIVLRAITRVFADYRPCEQVRVENCSLASNCNAIRIAYINDGDIRNVVMENITITESRRGIICQVPLLQETPERNLVHLQRLRLPGPEVENLRFSNISIAAQRPIWFRVSAGADARHIGNVRFENLEIAGGTPSLIEGNSSFRYANFTLENIRIRVEEQPLLITAPEEGARAAALIVTHCDHLTVRNLTVYGENSALAATSPVLHFESVEGLSVSGVSNRSSYLCAEAESSCVFSA